MARSAAELEQAIFAAELAYVKRPTKRNAEKMRERVLFLQGELRLQREMEKARAKGQAQ